MIRPRMPTIETLRAKYGPNWGLNVIEPKKKSERPSPTFDEVVQYYRTNPEAVARLKGDTGEVE